MKKIEIDDDLYQYIASQTQQIGESASDILRRLLAVSHVGQAVKTPLVVAESNVSAENSHQGQQVFDILTKQDLQAETNVVGRFLLILSALSRIHKNQFELVLDIKGRNRLYFGTSEAELLEGSHSSNPKAIPNSDFWVITNSNTTRKKMMLTEVAIKLGYSAEEAERIRDFL